MDTQSKLEAALELVSGRSTAEEIAARVGASPAEVRGWSELFLAGARGSSALETQARTARKPSREPRWRAAALAVVALGAVTVGANHAWSQACADPNPALPVGLTKLCPGTPATASSVNQNFSQLVTWVQQKVGTVGTGNVVVGANLTVNGADIAMGNVAGRGDGGLAIVHEASDTLVLNYVGQFSGGTRIESALNVTGDVSGLTATMTGCHDVADNCEDSGSTVFLDRMNNIGCPANEVLVDWNVNACGSQYQMVFRCCAITVK